MSLSSRCARLLRHSLRRPCLLGVSPQLGERSATAAHRIRLRKGQRPHPSNRFVGWGAPANIPVLAWRICADDQKILARAESTVTRAGGQDCDITGVYCYLMSIFTAQHKPRLSDDKAQDFMRR